MLYHTGTARYVTFQVHHSFQYTRQYTGAEYFEVRAIKAVSMQVFKCWKMGHFHKKDPPPAESYAKSEAEQFHHIFFPAAVWHGGLEHSAHLEHSELLRILKATSWASQGAARAVDWLCPAPYYVFWRDLLTRCLLCTNLFDAIVLFLYPGFIKYDLWIWYQTTRKNQKEVTITINRLMLYQVYEKERDGTAYVCMCGSNTRLNFQSEPWNLQNWAGHLRNSAVHITCF